MPRTHGEVLRHPFDEPEGRIHLRQLLHAGPGPPTGEDVVLEDVHHLVRQHVLRLAEVAGEEEHVALAERVGDAPRSLAEVAGHVVLPELGARSEDEDRLPLLELMSQQRLEARVGPLRHLSRVGRHLGQFWIVVHVEVLGLQHLPVELAELDMILAEVAALGAQRDDADGKTEEEWSETTHEGLLRGDGEGRGIAPESFQLIEGAQRGMEHVHDEIHIVQQDPPSVLEAFHRVHGHPFLFQRHHHAPGRGAHVCVRGPARHDEEIRHVRHRPQVEQDDVARLAVDEEGCSASGGPDDFGWGSDHRSCWAGANK